MTDLLFIKDAMVHSTKQTKNAYFYIIYVCAKSN